MPGEVPPIALKLQGVELQYEHVVTMHYGPVMAVTAPKGFLMLSHGGMARQSGMSPAEEAIHSWSVISSRIQQMDVQKWRWCCCLMRDTAAC